MGPGRRQRHGGDAHLTLPLGAYLAGPDGVPDAGANDDERLGAVEGALVVGTLLEWQGTEELTTNPSSGYPSVHLPEGDPPTVVDGVLLGGSDSGEGQLELAHPTLGSVTTRLLVTPPDWCPLGVQDSGPSSGGVCE